MGSRQRAVRGLCRRPRSPRRNAWQAAGDRGVRLPPRRRDLCPRHVDDLARPLLRDDPEPGRGVVAGRRTDRGQQFLGLERRGARGAWRPSLPGWRSRLYGRTAARAAGMVRIVRQRREQSRPADTKGVGVGKSVSVELYFGGRRMIKKKKKKENHTS